MPEGMITTNEKYMMMGLMGMVLLLTFKDLMGHTHSSHEDTDEVDTHGDHKYTRKSNSDPYASMDSAESVGLDDEDGFGMPSVPIEKKIPKTNLRHIITGPTIKITYWWVN